MNRRDAIQKAGLVLGYVITGPTLAAILNGCKASPELTYKPGLFNKDQALTIETLSEIIIPKTDTPGAKDVGVPEFIDALVKEVYSKDEQEKFLNELMDFNEDARKNYGNNFTDCSAEEQLAHFKIHHDKAISSSAGGGSTGWWNRDGGGEQPFILKVKELTLLGFFTSEAGATQVLQYNQVPGPYKGCVPLDEVGKAWAT